MARELLLIADIGGYTKFIREQRRSLAHAQVVIAKLLESVLAAAPPFLVEKLEGDAVFLHLPWSAGTENPDLMATVRRMRQGFISTKAAMLSARTCACDSCTQMENLRLKYVSHAGEAARQQVGPYRELAGLDVIVVHRMLKNDVPVPEYLLGSSAVLPLLDSNPTKLDHDFEGIGPTTTFFLDLSGEGPSSSAETISAPFTMKLLARAMLELGALKFRLGFARIRKMESPHE